MTAPVAPSDPSDEAVTMPLWETRLVALAMPVAGAVADHFHLAGGDAAAQAAVLAVATAAGSAIYLAHGIIAAIHAHGFKISDFGLFAQEAREEIDKLKPAIATAQPLVAAVEKLPAISAIDTRLSSVEQTATKLVASAPQADRKAVEEALRQIVPANVQPLLGLAESAQVISTPQGTVPSDPAPSAAEAAPVAASAEGAQAPQEASAPSVDAPTSESPAAANIVETPGPGTAPIQ